MSVQDYRNSPSPGIAELIGSKGQSRKSANLYLVAFQGNNLSSTALLLLFGLTFSMPSIGGKSASLSISTKSYVERFTPYGKLERPWSNVPCAVEPVIDVEPIIVPPPLLLPLPPLLLPPTPRRPRHENDISAPLQSTTS